MMIKSFNDLLSLMMNRPHLLGASIMVEFSFLGYLACFECVLGEKATAQRVFDLWHDACCAVHPEEPRFSLYCVKTSNAQATNLQLQPDPPMVFEFIAQKLSHILRDTSNELGRTRRPPCVPNKELERLLSLIETYCRPEAFFYHKAKAYEGFLLGLVSSYEYLFFGDLADATSGAKWRKEMEKVPFSSTRTLADVNLSQEQVVEQHFFYTEAEVKKSYDQVRTGVKGIAEKTIATYDVAGRRLLGL